MGPMSLPPGFRFHPKDDELVGYYLKRKVDGLRIELEVIPEIDLYKFDPWELPEKSFLPKRDMEWFFFCPRDRKYPSGSRTNRATGSGYWKATGKDRKIVCESSVHGLRKTLVFYRGRAPGGERTDWIMHEYRLCEGFSQGSPNFLGFFALCHVVKRNEHGPRTSDRHGASKAKMSCPPATIDFGSRKFPSQATSLFEHVSTPVTSPSANGTVVEVEPIVIDTDNASFSRSNVLSDASKAVSLGEGISSEPRIPTEFLNPAEAYTPCVSLQSPPIQTSQWKPIWPMSSAALPDCHPYQIPCPVFCSKIYCIDENMELQNLEWNPHQFMTSPINGMEAWNPVMSTICQQASEGEEGNLSSTW